MKEGKKKERKGDRAGEERRGQIRTEMNDDGDNRRRDKKGGGKKRDMRQKKE